MKLKNASLAIFGVPKPGEGKEATVRYRIYKKAIASLLQSQLEDYDRYSSDSLSIECYIPKGKRYTNRDVENIFKYFANLYPDLEDWYS